jgi:hypothetical protein
MDLISSWISAWIGNWKGNQGRLGDRAKAEAAKLTPMTINPVNNTCWGLVAIPDAIT